MMITLSPETIAAFDRRMERAGVPVAARAEYRKWARFYRDFCGKYGHPPRERGSLEPFLEKLAAKGQSESSRRVVAAAVRLLVGRGGCRGGAGCTPGSGGRCGG